MASDAVCAAAAPQSVDEVESAFQGALEALHRLLLLQEQLNTTLRQGWFNLSLARYNLGPQRVGALQYPATMTATTTLALTPASGSVGQAPTLTLDTGKEKSPVEAAKTPVEAEGAGRQAEGLRRRRAADEPAPIPPEESSLKEEPFQSEHKQRQADPLNWFGGLVPPALRNAQQDFALALSSSVELANVLSEMESFRKAYFMLVKVDDNSNPTLLLEEEVGVNTDVRSESMSPVCLDIELQGQSRTRKFPSVDTTGSTLMQEFESKYATSF